MDNQYIIMARRLRPETFSEIVGQKYIVDTLINSLKLNRLAQAYLFSGPRGVGKTTTARILSKAINCENNDTYEPCCKCSVCKEIKASSFADVIEIDGASNRGVDDVREIRNNLMYTPSAKERIYIIDEVHMLTKEAFNALLKTLEEPPPKTRFIFATTEIEKVPQTILSRCQRFDFKLLNENVLESFLLKIAKNEKIKIQDSIIKIIVRKSEGSVRDAISLLDQISVFKSDDINENFIKNIIGEVDNKSLMKMLAEISSHNVVESLKILEEMFNNGFQVHEIAKSLAEILFEILKSEEKKKLIILKNKIGIDRIIRFINLLSVYLSNKTNLSNKIILELNIAKMARMIDTTSIKDVIHNIETKTDSQIISNKNVSKQDKWTQFLERVQAFDSFLFLYIKKSELTQIDNNTMTIKLEDSGKLNLLKSSKKIKKLEDLASEIWGKQRSLNFISEKKDNSYIKNIENDDNVKLIKKHFDGKLDLV